jgi:hypothetical protein
MASGRLVVENAKCRPRGQKQKQIFKPNAHDRVSTGAVSAKSARSRLRGEPEKGLQQSCKSQGLEAEIYWQWPYAVTYELMKITKCLEADKIA